MASREQLPFSAAIVSLRDSTGATALLGGVTSPASAPAEGCGRANDARVDDSGSGTVESSVRSSGETAIPATALNRFAPLESLLMANGLPFLPDALSGVADGSTSTLRGCPNGSSHNRRGIQAKSPTGIRMQVTPALRSHPSTERRGCPLGHTCSGGGAMA
jgi:hypothetical protein